MKPLACEVTRITRWSIYWKAEGERKVHAYCDRAKFAASVGRVIGEE